MSALRPDLRIIADAIPAGVRALDIGCGDGALLAALAARGIEQLQGHLDALLALRLI